MAENNVNVLETKIEEIYKMRDAGYSVKEIEEALGLPESSVREHFNQVDRLNLRVGRTRRMLDEGFTVSEIAAKLKVSEDDVKRYIKHIERAEENRQKING